MDQYPFLNPTWWVDEIKNGSLIDKVDKRISSALLLLVGAKLAYKWVLSPLHSLCKYYLRPQKDLFKRYNGGWAIVTGASDGIGLGYSKELARRGFNVFMVSRSKDKLKSKAAEVKKINPKVEVKTFEFNFNRAFTEEGYKPLFDAIDELDDVSMLVNNVGYVSDFKMPFHSTEILKSVATYQINIIPIVHLTHHLLSKFTERKSR